MPMNVLYVNQIKKHMKGDTLKNYEKSWNCNLY